MIDLLLATLGITILIAGALLLRFLGLRNRPRPLDSSPLGGELFFLPYDPPPGQKDVFPMKKD